MTDALLYNGSRFGGGVGGCLKVSLGWGGGVGGCLKVSPGDVTVLEVMLHVFQARPDAYKTDASDMESQCVDFDNKYNAVKKLGFESEANPRKHVHA